MSRSIKPAAASAFRQGSVPDAGERARALDMSLHPLVRAPAGSGKTSLLVARYLKALALVTKPEEVVAITFTKKAATEMRSRIIEALADEDAKDPVVRAAQAADRERGWSLQSNPGRIRTLTIDAFSASITRQLPLTSGLGGPGSPTEDSAPLYEEAILRLFAELDQAPPEPGSEEARLHAALETLLLTASNRADKLVEPLSHLLAVRERWLGSLLARRQGGQSGVQGEVVLRRFIGAALRELDAALDGAFRDGLLAAWAARVEEGVDDTLDPALDKQVRSGVWPAPLPDRLKQWVGLMAPITKADGTLLKARSAHAGKGWPPGTRCKQLIDQLLKPLEASSNAEAVNAALPQLFRLPKAAIPASVVDYTEAFDLVLLRLVMHLHAVFAESGEMDFTEISQRAIAALRGMDDSMAIMERLDAAIRHLLIDEMQDTSHAQLELIKLLTSGWQPGDGRSLFMVGDPQQSIYGFRDADVSLFIRLWEEARLHDAALSLDLPLEVVNLNTNFRSLPQVVDFNNRMFRAVFPVRSDVSAGAVAFSEARPWMRSASEIVAADPTLAGLDIAESAVWHRHMVPAETGADAEAAAVVASIREELQAQPPRSIAVIARGREQMRPIIAGLRDAGIGYVAEDIDRLDKRPEVRPVMALARALWHRADSAAWVSLLRSPLVGLSWADLHALRAENDPEGMAADWLTLITRQLDRAPGSTALGPDAQDRLGRFVTLYRRFAQSPQYRARLGQQVESLWHALGGPATLRHGSELRNVQTTLQLLAESVGEGVVGSLDGFRRRIQRLYGAPPEANARVSLMTIHKSKGLEFDTVHVVGMGKRPPPADSPMLIVFAEDDDVLVIPKPPAGRDDDADWHGLYDFGRRLVAQRAEAEDQRVAYVAGTRASVGVHWHESWTEKDGEMQPPGASSLAGRLSAGVSLLPGACIREHQQVRSVDEGVAPGVSAKALVPLTWRLPAGHLIAIPETLSYVPQWRESARPSEGLLSASERGPDDERHDGAGDTLSVIRRRLMGDMFHAAMEHIAKSGLGHWVDEQGRLAKTLDGLEASLSAGFRRYGMPLGDVEAGVKEVMGLLQRGLRSEVVRWILANHPWHRAEYALSGYVDGRWVSAVIDRCFDDGENLWVIDYKTGARSPEAAAHYAGQLDEYARLLGELRPGKTVLKGIYWAREVELERL